MDYMTSAPDPRLKNRVHGTIKRFQMVTPGFPLMFPMRAPYSCPGSGLYPASEKTTLETPPTLIADTLRLPLSLPNFFSLSDAESIEFLL